MYVCLLHQLPQFSIYMNLQSGIMATCQLPSLNSSFPPDDKCEWLTYLHFYRHDLRFSLSCCRRGKKQQVFLLPAARIEVTGKVNIMTFLSQQKISINAGRFTSINLLYYRCPASVFPNYCSPEKYRADAFFASSRSAS